MSPIRASLLSITALSLASCNIGPGAYETASPLDCDFCSGESVCLDGGCEPAFPRTYRVTITKATFPKQPSQDQPCWDNTPCSGPEPRLRVFVNEEEILSIAGHEDDYVVYGRVFDLELYPDSSLLITAEDEDPGQIDQIAVYCGFAPLQGKHVRSGVLSCLSEEGGAIEASIRLPPDDLPPDPMPPVPQIQ